MNIVRNLVIIGVSANGTTDQPVSTSLLIRFIEVRDPTLLLAPGRRLHLLGVSGTMRATTNNTVLHRDTAHTYAMYDDINNFHQGIFILFSALAEELRTRKIHNAAIDFTTAPWEKPGARILLFIQDSIKYAQENSRYSVETLYLLVPMEHRMRTEEMLKSYL